MKLYTFYTETHKNLLDDYFLPSFEKHNLKRHFDLEVLNGDQFSKTGDFNSDGTLDTWDQRLGMFIELIEENIDKWIIYSDCDIQFFGDFYEDIMSLAKDEKTDMFAQSDQGTICMGFMMVKCNKISKKFFQKIRKELKNFSNDQMCANHYKGHIRYQLLPEDKYFTIASVNGGGVWKKGDHNMILPDNMLVHHGNYTIGIENKVALMDFVKTRMEK
jgi:hypothetical protein